MKPEGLLPHSQVPATCPYPEPAQSSPYLVHPTFWRPILMLYSHLCLGLPTGLLPSGFPIKTLYTPLPSSWRATCLSHPILLDFVTRTILAQEYRSLSSSLCCFLHCPVTSSLWGPNILLNTLFSNTLSLRSSLIVSDQVSHPYTTGKFVVLYILTAPLVLWNTPWISAWILRHAVMWRARCSIYMFSYLPLF